MLPWKAKTVPLQLQLLSLSFTVFTIVEPQNHMSCCCGVHYLLWIWTMVMREGISPSMAINSSKPSSDYILGYIKSILNRFCIFDHISERKYSSWLDEIRLDERHRPPHPAYLILLLLIITWWVIGLVFLAEYSGFFIAKETLYVDYVRRHSHKTYQMVTIDYLSRFTKWGFLGKHATK